MKRQRSRRDFLTGKAAADALAGAAADALSDDAQGPSHPTQSVPGGLSYLIHVTRRAMACEFEVCFNAGQYEQDTPAALEVLDLVEALEDQMSAFRESSEICRINRTAARGPVEVEPRLFELLELGMRLYRETQGAFDLTAGLLGEVWGFARRAGAVPEEARLAEALERVGSHLVELDPQRKTIRFSREGVQLNLGSIGKGYALDRCREKLLQGGIADFLLHGGHSSVLAGGSQRQPPPIGGENAAGGWLVGVRHPLRPNRRLAEIRLRDQALATSGSRIQSFVHQGRRYGHILDPRCGRPAEGVLAATVIAPGAALADALSTAFYVMGPQPALEYCRAHPEIGTVLVSAVRHSGGIEISTAGLPEQDLSLL